MNTSSIIQFPQRDENDRPLAQSRLTPQSLEAEQSTLGAMLLERDAIARGVELLGRDDFYRENHRLIFTAITGLFDKGEPVDVVTVSEELRKRGQLEQAGGIPYIGVLIEACPSSANIDAYARVVSEKSLLRRLIHTCDQITSNAYGDVEDVSATIDTAERLMFDVGSRRIKDGFSHIKPLLMQAYDQIERQFQHKGEATGVSTGFYDLDEITSGLQPTDLIIVAARPSMGKCLALHCSIVNPDTGAVKTIEQCVQERQSLVPNLSRLGRVQTAPISDWIDSGVKPTFRVVTRLGREVEVTGHHPFLTVRGWVPLHDLKVGDKIAVPRSMPIFGGDTSVSFERVRLLAYLIAEGGLSGSVPKWTNADPVLVSDFAACVEREFPGLQIKPANSSGIDWKIVRPDRGRGQAPNGLTAWLRELKLWGHKAESKYLPPEVWCWDKARLAELMRVLFSCDGTIYRCGSFLRIEFAVASRQLARDVQHALLRFGIVAKLWRKTERCWRVEVTDPGSVLRFNAEIGWIGEKSGRVGQDDIERALPKRASNAGHPPREVWDAVRLACQKAGISLIELARRAGETKVEGKLGGYNSHTNRSLPSHRLQAYAEVLQDINLMRLASPDIYWDEITSIENVGEQQVYDLTVPDGSNFIAQDVCVHNTALCLNIAHRIALHDKLPVAIFSLEMSKDQLVQRLICSEAEINSRDLRRGFLQDQDWHRVTNAVNNLYQAPIFIDDQPGQSTFEMRAKARRLIAEHGPLGLIVVDYLQLAHHAGKNENRVQEISEIARSFKSMARELKCPLIALSQLSRAVEQREDKRPILSDLRESGCLTGDARVFLPDSGVYKRIDSLQHLSGFRVLALNEETWKMEPRRVLKAFSTGVKPVYRLTTRLGRSVRATANHPFLTMEGWKRLDALGIGEHLAAPRSLPEPPQVLEGTISHDELALLGHLIGDGSTLEKRGSYYTSGEEKLALFVRDAALRIFGNQIAPRVKLDARQRYEVALVSSTRLTHGKHNAVAQWLRKLGAWDFRSWQKKVPDMVFAQSNEAVGVFLRHLWCTDGAIHLRKSGGKQIPVAYYSSSSEELSQGVQSLLLRLGINARLKRVPQVGKGRDNFHVIVTGQPDVEAFLDRVGAFGAQKEAAAQAIREHHQARTPNPNRDVVPALAWPRLALPAAKRRGLSDRALQAALGNRYCGSSLYRQNLSRTRAARLAHVVESDELARLASSDVYWDQVVSIEPDGEEEVYDLTVEGLHNFVAENLTVHNSIEAEADVVAFIYRPSYYKNKIYRKDSKGRDGRGGGRDGGSDGLPDEPDPDEGIAEIIIGKQRNGPTGTVRLGFEPNFARFTNLAQEPHGRDY